MEAPTLTAAEGSGAYVRVRAATLDVRTGPAAGARVRVEAPRFVIGSGELADLRLADRTVSREHLVLSLREDGLLVRDDSSRNGTFVGAIRIRDALLAGDAVLRVGSSTIGVSIDGAPIDIPVLPGERFGDAYGSSTAMRHVFHKLARAAESDVTVLLEGESGVGKEVLARAVHAASSRRSQPFVTVDCSAVPAALFESELFGHRRGAFTGADAERVGLVEQADHGTLFLDEIGELPLELQPKLLRVLEQREVRRVGGREARKVNIRVIAATNVGLLDAVSRGAFREDLFYRLAVARLVVPPLRDRPEDVAPLARAFLRDALGEPEADLDPEIAAMLSAYRWPGNVRELRNVVERHALLGVRDRQGLFDDASRPSAGLRPDIWTLRFHDARRVVLEDFERAYLQRALAASGNVVVRAAEAAGIPRPTFYRMVSRLGLKVRDG